MYRPLLRLVSNPSGGSSFISQALVAIYPCISVAQVDAAVAVCCKAYENGQ
jgi:hypothetical protein